jgi:hypothetical protein
VLADVYVLQKHYTSYAVGWTHTDAQYNTNSCAINRCTFLSVQVRQRTVLVRALSSLQRGVVVAQQHRGLQQWRAVCKQAAAAVAAAKALAVRHSTAGNVAHFYCTLHCARTRNCINAVWYRLYSF